VNQEVIPQLPADTELRARKEEGENNAKAQSRREENEKDPVVTCRGMGILPMITTGDHGRDARGTWGTALLFALKGTGPPRVPRSAGC